MILLNTWLITYLKRNIFEVFTQLYDKLYKFDE